MKKEIDFSDKYIRWFSDLSNKDVKIAGGKGASLGEMFNHRFPVPPGFVVTASAFSFFVEGIKDKIKEIMSEIDFEDPADLDKNSKKIRKLIEEQEMPEELKTEILESYHILSTEKIDEKGVSQSALNILRNSQEPIFVSVRSSATTEDLADASFAGQQQSFLNVKGEFELIEHIKKCFSSLYTARSMYYRKKKGFTEEQALLAVVVQKMIDSEKSGVVFSKNPISLNNEVVVESVFGLGEGIVSGMIHPDNYVVSGKTPEELKIKEIKTADKKIAVVRSGSGENKVVKLSPEKAREQVLNRGEILEIANYSLQLEQHYQKPQDIEFAIESEKIYIIQSRPITTQGVRDKGELTGKVLLEGLGASPGIGVGNVRIIKSMNDLFKIKKGDVLVTEMTDPDMVVSMQKSVAIITDEGGMTSHAAIVSREMGIPAVVGTGKATSVLKEGMKVTVDGAHGKVYEGQVAETQVTEIKPVVETKSIHLKVIVDLPEFAKRAAESNVKSIGLTRIEGMIASLGKHPLQYEKENDTADYEKVLEEGIKRILEPFEQMWIRASDIRSDEYASLKGAPEAEMNPMMGMHGIRFSLKHPKIFEAELKAVSEVARRNPDKKIGIMFPQVISIEEVRKAKEYFNRHKKENMLFGVMVETPAAVQIIEDICKEGVDFISFGTNDLTQFTLGVDRGEDEVQYLYNEMHPAVLSQIGYVIEVCSKYDVETSICGQAGSKPEMVKFLLEKGIKSISVNADMAYDISVLIKELEAKSEKTEQEIKRGFDKRKQEGMLTKEELNQKIKTEKKENMTEADVKEERIIENQEKEKSKKKTAVCDNCRKEFRLRFRPRKGSPVYCKSCYKSSKKIPGQEETEADPSRRIEQDIKAIEEEKQEYEQNKQNQEEKAYEKSQEETGDDFNLESELGVYSPDEDAEEEHIPESYNYNLDEEKEEFSDIF